MITLILHTTYVGINGRQYFVYTVSGDEASLAAYRARAATFGRFHSLSEKKGAINDNKLYVGELTARHWKRRTVMPVAALWQQRPGL